MNGMIIPGRDYNFVGLEDGSRILLGETDIFTFGDVYTRFLPRRDGIVPSKIRGLEELELRTLGLKCVPEIDSYVVMMTSGDCGSRVSSVYEFPIVEIGSI